MSTPAKEQKKEPKKEKKNEKKLEYSTERDHVFENQPFFANYTVIINITGRFWIFQAMIEKISMFLATKQQLIE